MSDSEHHHLHKAYPCLQSYTKPSTAVRHQTTSAAQSLPLSAVRHQTFNSCQTSNTISCTKLTLVCSQTPSLQQLSDIQHCQLHKAYPCLQSDTKPSTAVSQTSNTNSCTKLTLVCSQAPSLQQLSNIQHCQRHKAYPTLDCSQTPSLQQLSDIKQH